MRPCSAATMCFLALVPLAGLTQTGKPDARVAGINDRITRAPNAEHRTLNAEVIESALFPFVLQWDDATPSVVNLSGWLPKPAGKFGQVRADADGHLYAGKERIRFFGVDLSFSANLPTHADAEKVAARLAKFGINIVRFHIMDMRHFPEGIPARITLPFPAAAVVAWSLDERGQRKAALVFEADAKGMAVVAIGPERQTIWYEVEVK